ncbi:MAG: LytR C-terminal domain-containing protein [Acidimicrobiales bacterium]
MESHDDHRDHDDGEPRPSFDRSGLIRGLLVVVTALAIGGFLLTRFSDDGTSTAAATDTAAGPTTSTADGGSAATDDTTGSPESDTGDAAGTGEGSGDGGVMVGSADVPVLVLNAAGTQGAAGAGAERLTEEGFTTLTPKNATTLGDTQVLYTPGHETTAADVAEVFNLDDSVVAELDPNNPPVVDLEGAGVVVVIGGDGLIEP